MNLNKKVLYVAVAASLGAFAATQANAAATVFGSEVSAGSDLATTTRTITLTTAFAPTTANPLYLQVSLTGGASFDTLTSTSLTCSGGAGSAIVAPAYITLAAGGPATAIATFVVTASTASLPITSCQIVNGSAHVGGWPANVNENTVLTYGGNLAPTATVSTALFAASSFFTNSNTATTNTALVASGFVTFSTANASAGSTTTTAKIGAVRITLNSNIESTGGAANLNDISSYATSISFSIAGAPLAASLTTTGTLFITMASAAAHANAICTDPAVASGAGGSSAVTFTAFAAPATADVNFAVCWRVTGGTIIPAGTITVGVTGVPNTDGNNAAGSAFQVSTLIANTTTLGTITHNGSSTEVLNLPPSTNADAGYLRVTNNSAGAGAVTITVYTEAGSALATNCQIASSLGSQGTLVTAVSAIEAACAITPPSGGRYRAVVSGAFATMRAQGMARNANGTLLNNSGDTSGFGN